MHLIQTKLELLHYTVVALLSLLVISSDYFLLYGTSGAVLLAVLLMVLLACYVGLFFLEKKNGDFSMIARVLLVSLAVALLFGEYGASTDSRITFLLSIWKLAMVPVAAILLWWDLGNGASCLKRFVSSTAGRIFLVFLAVILLALVVQLALGIPSHIKGILRSLTFYLCLALAVYSFTALLTTKGRLITLKNVFRLVLLASVAFSLFEMVANFHLPTSWLYSDDPETTVLLATIMEANPNWRWVTATGLFFNPNNHCLFMAVLAALSLPDSEESDRVQIASVSLVCVALLVASMLGATIVSLALLFGLVLWAFISRAPASLRLLTVLFAFLCMLVLPDPLMKVLMDLVGCEGGGAAISVAGDFGTQVDNYENKGGSMWMRLTIYKDLVFAILANPLGIGAGEVQLFFTQNPSISGLVDPHNWWLEFALCYGWLPVVGLVVLFATLVSLIFKDMRNSSSDIAGSVLVGMFVVALGSLAPSSSEYNVLLWLPSIVGIAIYVNHLVVRQETHEDISGNV